MFGFPKDVQLKHDILLYLDRQSEAVTAEMIAAHVGNVSAQTIRKKINQLSIEIRELYPNNKISLENDTRYGVKLLRRDVTLMQILEKLYTDSFVYAIFQLLIEKRTFSAYQFCVEHKISVSKLKRAITQINTFLASYEMRISVGSRVYIKGNESQIRCLFFMFLFYVHRQITTIHWISEKQYLSLAEKICYSLYIPPVKGTIEVMGLWLYIQDVSRKTGQLLDELSLSNQVPKSMPKPSFLLEFDDNEWHYFLLILYGLDLVQAEAFEDFDTIHQNHFFDVASKFIHSFEELTIFEKRLIFQKFHQMAILNELIPLNINLLAIFSPVSLKEIMRAYPSLDTHFQKLWASLIADFPNMDTVFYHRRILLLFLQVAPTSEMLKPLNIYFCSSFSKDIVEGMKRHIKNFFKNKYQITYTPLAQSDCVISTENLLVEAMDKKETLIISPQLTVKDLVYLDQQFYALETME
ncbi:helix-turn-helix domain-containing protein [Enterococcus saccharolyticus]|uniref:helix-turn-helix domain-containing protein n=1 Tax=Enterococcus saccharolyticus TaxID=41997 RepID=UPI001E4349EC|nr:helix-turn-helix domain-containing protein [Enterococcus saccharolyticus]MCD5003495.1 helix-turn-helix domain-containing protein [Enterococcus saccharolyticus]